MSNTTKKTNNLTNSTKIDVKTNDNPVIPPSNNKELKSNDTVSIGSKIEIKENNTKNQNDNETVNNNKNAPQTSKTAATPHQQLENSNHKKGKNKRARNSKPQPRRDDPLQMVVNQALSTCQNRDEIKALCFVLQPNPNILEQAFKLVQRDLLAVLHEKFPNYCFDVSPFGSTLNGLAFKDSDFDIYVRIEPKDKPTTKIIYTVIAGMQRQCTFQKIVPIVHAKIPIIKCVHKQTGYSCDISFSNAIGVFNTKIMRHLLTFDYRIHPLAIILKYWMRTHELSGTGRITNYCLMLMIIYYLQTIKPPILPPYNDFQKDILPYEVEYWNLSCDVSIHSMHCNVMKVSDLLTGFFEFYSTFNFVNQIISPLYGITYDRNKFKNSIPNELGRYKHYLKVLDKDAIPLNISTPVCIQDPFNLSLNVAACITRAHMDLFQRELCYAAERCDIALNRPNQQTRPADLLLRLFNEFAPTPKITVDSKFIELHINSSKREFECKLQPIEFELAIIRTMLMNSRSSSGSTEVIEPIHVQKIWTEKMIEFIECIFRRLFLCEIQQINLNDDNCRVAKYPKLNDDKDVGSIVVVKQFLITSKYDVYSDRKALKPNSSTYLFEHEELSKKNMQLKKNPIELSACVDISIGDSMKFIVLNLFDQLEASKKDKKKCVPLKKLFNNFVQSVRNHLRAYFLQYRDEYLKSMKAAAAASISTTTAQKV